MLDAGLELETEQRNALENLKRVAPENWNGPLLRTIKANMTSTPRGIPRKLAYGSEFPYAETEKWLAADSDGTKITASLAMGGLSNVWGATVLPYTEADIADWPISLADLAPHYESVLSFMNMSAVKDDLASVYPLYCNHHRPIRTSKQAQSLLADLNRHKNALLAQGLSFGHSRLAVRSVPSQDDSGCVYCGLCMYGCPYELIYNSSHTLAELSRFRNFRYIKNVIVKGVNETAGGVTIAAVSRATGEHLTFDGCRVYLACGALSTTKILLDSLGAYDYPLTIRDSQWFLLPLLRYQRTANVATEELHTLSQLFIELNDPNLSGNTIHLQVYTYNDLYASALRNVLGKMHPFLKLPVSELLNRLIIIQGYLHSNDSSTIAIKLTADRNEKKLKLRAKPSASVQHALKGIIAKLHKNRKFFAALPIRWLLEIGKPGAGNHIGGTFPMKKTPSKFESDCLGRPYGYQKVHAVDATVFPSIPATTITLSVMANAHRIASLSLDA